MKRLVFAAICIMASAQLFAQDGEFSIAKWRGNAQCALSYTFDDGLADQYTLAFPVMKECGIRGTFWLVGSKISNPSGFRSRVERHTPTMTWEMVKEMAAAGQEMSSHGFAHAKLAQMDNDAIIKEVLDNKRLLKEKAGIDALTFAYPFNAKINKNKESIVELVESQGLIGSRRAQKAFGGGITPEKAKALVERAKKKHEWLVFMTHGIARGYDAFKDPQVFYSHLRWVSKEPGIWIAPFCEVCAYEKERNATTLEFEKLEDGSLRVTPKVEGLDASLFKEPLTLVDASGKVVMDFNPFEGAFIINR